jgi:hypothetical protein
MYVPNHPKNKNIFKRAQQFRERTVPAPTDRKGLAGSSRKIALRNGGKTISPTWQYVAARTGRLCDCCNSFFYFSSESAAFLSDSISRTEKIAIDYI